MAAPERLRRVALALAEAVSARERGERVKLPVIRRADAAGLVNMMHAQLDDAIARRDAEIGARLACGKGCNGCCSSAVVVTEGEAIAVAEWLREPEHADARAKFEAAYAKWRAALGELAGRAGDPRDADENRAWCLSVQQRQALCAFNHDGACSIYPVRPSLCRKAHALDTSAHCGSDGARVHYYEHEETEAIHASQRPMQFALHLAVRPDDRLDLLCSAAHRLLGGAAAGRNEPCPCGSGKKYKKCCGT